MSNNTKYRILDDEYKKPYLRQLQLAKFPWILIYLPLFAFLFDVVYSVLFNFENSTSTHCHVYNFLPSISAAIGNASPQKEVFQIAIALHAIPRFYMTASYWQYNQEFLAPRAKYLLLFACTLNVIENTGLIILSFWTSSINHQVHKNAFISFVGSSELYMLLLLYLHTKYRRISKQRNRIEMKSLNWKRRLVVINLTSILLATYFYMRHNSLCEPFVYTIFAFFEYIVVLSNMVFHLTAYYDFQSRDQYG